MVNKKCLKCISMYVENIVKLFSVVIANHITVKLFTEGNILLQINVVLIKLVPLSIK